VVGVVADRSEQRLARQALAAAASADRQRQSAQTVTQIPAAAVAAAVAAVPSLDTQEAAVSSLFNTMLGLACLSGRG
jgi:hypothetical protein